MSFDLNINNYTRDELIDMFQLPSNFDKNILEINETKLRDSILNNKMINRETQSKTIDFISKAKELILNGKNQSSQNNNNNKSLKTIEDLYNSNFQLKSTDLLDPSEHMVQDRASKSYLTSFPTDFHEGIINPIKKRTTRKYLNIDSRFRDNYYTTSSTNFNFILPTNINNVLQMELTAVEIPTYYYVISKQYGNNFFSITVNDGTNTSTTVINIPDGNYTQSTLQTIINSQLTIAAAPFSHISFVINLTSSNTGSGQTLVGPNGVGPVTSIELNFQADRFGVYDNSTQLPLKFGWILGFRNGIYTGNVNYVSEGIVDLNGPRYLYLVVDDYNNNVSNSFFGAYNSSISNNNILARIQTGATTFNIVEQNNFNSVTATPRMYFGPVNLNAMNIQLLDEYGRIVDFNNMDFSFCLSLITVYDL
jgi:hypothetical protein